MKLRVITATRGESPFWPETLTSMTAATSGAQHVIVCPVAAVAAMAAQAKEARVISEKGSGLYVAMNQGLAEPAGDWDAFTWINDDDVLRAPGFGELVATMDRDPTIGVAFGRVDLIDSRGARVCALPIARQSGDLATLFARNIIPFAQPGTVIRREVVARLGGFAEAYRIVGDMDFFVRAVVVGTRFAYVDAHVASFRLNRGQLSKQAAEVAKETFRALRPLANVPVRAGAVTRFRLANWRAYAERIRRHGWKSLREIYDRTE